MLRRPPAATLRALLLMLVTVAACAPSTTPPVERGAVVPAPAPDVQADRDAVAEPTPSGEIGEGLASWYGPNFVGRPTANGEIFDPSALTAAHRTLPFDTRVRVTLPATGRSVVVRINDRGPFKPNRVIDLSRAAAAQIGLTQHGVARVHLAYADSGPGQRRVAPHPSLSGYDVVLPGVPEGSLRVVRNGSTSDVVVRVVEVPPPEGANLAGDELLVAPSLAERLGPVVEVGGS